MEKIIVDRIKSNKSIALLAPSYVIDFKYPNIIGMLKELGFDKVTELTFGARMVNWWYVDYIKKHPEQRYFIASPCPTLVSYIRSKYPDLVQYLMPYASPMLAQARIIRKHYPDHLNIFISPCIAKQSIEAPLHPKDVDGVITYKSLKEEFDNDGIFSDNFDREYQFDSLIQEYTKIYPVSGGLGNTSHIHRYFKNEEIFVDDTIPNIEPVLQAMRNGSTQYRFLDILNCKGGCIGGPAIVNQNMTTEERKLKVESYIKDSSKRNLGAKKGRLEYAEGIGLEVDFN
ncbi:MAG: hypothetical protein BWY19_00129 [bacterium ADurb.Bin212]|nr:MAG: hypothetical protein BWY19_00129 [bacterium ADurb.Bin212]